MAAVLEMQEFCRKNAFPGFFLVILFAFLCLDIKCNVIKIDLHGALRAASDFM